MAGVTHFFAAAALAASPISALAAQNAASSTEDLSQIADSKCAPLLDAGGSKGIKFGKDSKKTGLFGAVVGAAAGAFIAARKSKDKDKTGDIAQGVAIGAAAGGAIGVGIGQIAENRRAAFESESAYLDCEISYAEQELAEREEQTLAAEQDLAEAKAEADDLRARIAANEAKNKELKKLRKRWKKKIEKYDADLAAWQEQIDYLDLLAKREASTSSDSVKALAKRRQALAAKKGELQDRYNRLAFVRDEFVVQSNALQKI